MVHQGGIELGLHLQQAGLLVGIAAGPVVVRFSHNTVQKPKCVRFHRDGGHHLIVVYVVVVHVIVVQRCRGG